MKVTGYGSITTNNVNKRRGTSSVSGGGDFAELLSTAESGDTAPASATNDVAAAALNNLLALQEISEEEVQRKKLVQQGKNMLDVLEDLRRQLLTGSMPLKVLKDLDRQLSIKKQMVNDPHLNAIIEDIELRAAVELAKLEKALENQSSPPLT